MLNNPVESRFGPLTPRILLVEDDDELREGLAENLRLSGMSVLEADCGRAFHEARQRAVFDIAILDVNLPDASGFDLAASMAKDARRPGVIMLTARARQEDRIRGYTEGADLYMTKPVAGAELLLAVRNLSRRIHLQREPQSGGASGWHLDAPMRRLISADGRFIELSGREILLIEQFVGRGGSALSRAVLSKALGYGLPGPENRALDAALRRLRQKFDAAGIEQPIISVNNLGLRFTGLLTVR
ncbi:hypothetical protein CKA34_01800 [Rhizobium sp. 11515TR]|nr:hypothetical protein CKA34_01800 [Rhizobium sp. 11515TR]